MAAIKPGDDFDEYINSKWRSTITIPPDKSSYSVSDEVDDALFKDIQSICKAAVKSKIQPAALFGAFYASGMASRAQHNGVETVKQLLNRIDCVRDTDDVIKATVEHMQNGFIATFQIVVSPDEKDTSISRLHLAEGDVPILNLDFYAKPRSIVMKQYAAYLRKVGKLFDVSGLDTVIHIETTIAKALNADDDHGHPDRRYNRITENELQKAYSNIPWTILWKSLGFKHPQRFILLPDPKYFLAIDRLFRILTIDEWRILLKSQIIHSLIRFLPPPFDELHYSFFGRVLHGDTRKKTQERLVIDCIREGIPDILTQQFIIHFGRKRAAAIRTAVTQMFHRIRSCLAEHIDVATWMDRSTKTKALAKVAAMEGKIAYPDYLKRYAGLILHPQRFVNNIIACNRWGWTRDWARLDKSINKTEWFNGAIEVNAYYYPENNTVVIPFGILRPPFYDGRKSLAWNLGGVGCVIGHEICHGFDNEGKEYDAKGNLSKWWSMTDLLHFTRYADKMRNALSAQSHAGGKVDGILTLAEGLADLAGLRIALDALLKTLVRSDPKERLLALRDFFTSYAVSWRKKERILYAKGILATDVHPPTTVRINLIVSQIPEWYEAFDIQQGDKLFVKATERILTPI